MIKVIEKLLARNHVLEMDKLFVLGAIICIFLGEIGILWLLMIYIALILAKDLKVLNFIPRKSLDSHPKKAKANIYSPNFKTTQLNPKFKVS